MSDEAKVVEEEKTTESKTKIFKPSGISPPELEEILKNIDDYDFRINEFVISPKIEIYNKKGRLVKLIENASIRRISGTINPEYADKFLDDLVNDSKVGVAQNYNKLKTQQIQEQKQKQNKEN